MPEKKEEDPKKIKCFRCQGMGHHQSDCVNLPVCYKCKEEGHMAAECVDFHDKTRDLKMYGFTIADQGFYCINIPGEGVCSKAVSIIQVLQGEASEKKIEGELENLINSNWEWQVKQVDAREYTAIFPDESSLETFSKISEILLSGHGIKVRVVKSNMDPDAVEVLQTTWVKIYGLLAIACKEDIVMRVATLAGEPLVVDELSLIKTGPVRVKMNCRDPHKLRGFVRIFFNKVGYDIRFVSEKYKDKSSYPPTPPDRRNEDDEEGEEDEGDSDVDCDRKHKKVQGKGQDKETNLHVAYFGKMGEGSKGQEVVHQMDMEDDLECYELDNGGRTVYDPEETLMVRKGSNGETCEDIRRGIEDLTVMVVGLDNANHTLAPPSSFGQEQGILFDRLT
jgi:hypothetical protein